MKEFFGSLNTFYKGNMVWVLVAVAVLVGLGFWKKIKVLWIGGLVILGLFLLSGMLAGTSSSTSA